MDLHSSRGSAFAPNRSELLKTMAALSLAAVAGCSDGPSPTNDDAGGGPKPTDVGVEAQDSGADAGQACEGFVEVASGGVAVVAEVNANGGVFTPEGNASWSFDLPPGAVVSRSCFAVIAGEAHPSTPPSYLEGVGPYIRFAPSASSLEPAGVLSLSYEQEDMVEGGIEELLLAVQFLDPQTGAVEPVPVVTHDLDRNLLQVEIESTRAVLLTRFAVRLVAGGVVTSAEDIERINQEIESVLASLPDDSARLTFLEENAEYLGAYIAAAERTAAGSPLDSFPGLGIRCLSVLNCDDKDDCTRDSCPAITEGCENVLDVTLASPRTSAV